MINEFLIIFIIVIIHEIGHALAATYYNWSITSITIYPYGGCTKLESNINKSMKEELVIMLLGPISQIILYLLVTIIHNNLHIISPRDYNIFKNYHYIFLIFNLLPIYPLDGGKLLNILTNYYLPFKLSNKIVIISSLILILIIMILLNNPNFYIMSILIISDILIYYKRQDYIYNKFLLDRYLHNYNFKKETIINNFKNMYRQRRHIIKTNNKYLTEKQYLYQRFKKRGNI